VIHCNLVKYAQANKILLTVNHKDLFDGHSIPLNMDPERFKQFLTIQEQYHSMQKELKFLFQLHGGE
jgi:hypothetical protein